MKIMSLMTHPPVRPPFIFRKQLFYLVLELSVPPLKMYERYTVLVQKGNKDIIKVVHVTPVG